MRPSFLRIALLTTALAVSCAFAAPSFPPSIATWQHQPVDSTPVGSFFPQREPTAAVSPTGTIALAYKRPNCDVAVGKRGGGGGTGASSGEYTWQWKTNVTLDHEGGTDPMIVYSKGVFVAGCISAVDNDNAIGYATTRSTDDGDTWSPWVTAVGYTGLFTVDKGWMTELDGQIFLAYELLNETGAPTVQPALNIAMITSSDQGLTWTPPQFLQPLFYPQKGAMNGNYGLAMLGHAPLNQVYFSAAPYRGGPALFGVHSAVGLDPQDDAKNAYFFDIVSLPSDLVVVNTSSSSDGLPVTHLAAHEKNIFYLADVSPFPGSVAWAFSIDAGASFSNFTASPFSVCTYSSATYDPQGGLHLMFIATYTQRDRECQDPHFLPSIYHGPSCAAAAAAANSTTNLHLIYMYAAQGTTEFSAPVSLYDCYIQDAPPFFGDIGDYNQAITDEEGYVHFFWAGCPASDAVQPNTRVMHSTNRP